LVSRNMDFGKIQFTEQIFAA
jgi:hypothetical protein